MSDNKLRRCAALFNYQQLDYHGGKSCIPQWLREKGKRKIRKGKNRMGGGGGEGSRKEGRKRWWKGEERIEF